MVDNVPLEVTVLRDRLDAIALAAGQLHRHLHDLHVCGFDPTSGDEERVSNGSAASRPPPSGDPLARRIFHRLNSEITNVERMMIAAQQAVLNLLMVGAGAPETRGSLISKSDFKAQVTRQRRREEAGVYSPVRLQDQPSYPGRG